MKQTQKATKEPLPQLGANMKVFLDTVQQPPYDAQWV